MTLKDHGLIYLTLCAVVILAALLISRGASAIPTDKPDGGTVVIIDAGHGGEDGGAVSVTGRHESRLNLAISLRLRDLLHLLGQPTKMIRTEDVSVYTEGETIAAKKVSDIRNRVKTVEQTPGALLISIHQNHFPEGKYRGAQVFYAKTDGSDILAKRLQTILTTQVDTRNHRQCKPAQDVYLMSHISCTAVLVECGFLSNPAEEALLHEAQYQKKLAAAVCGGVIQHLEEQNEV